MRFEIEPRNLTELQLVGNCLAQIQASRDVERDGTVRLYDAKGGDGTAYLDPARVLPWLDRWLEIRLVWIAARTTQTPAQLPLFVKRDLYRMSTRYVQRLVRRLREECGITGVCTPHVLRHTYATELLGEGFTISEVQASLRHVNLQTTAIYLHVRDDALRCKMSRRESTFSYTRAARAAARDCAR